MTPRRLLLPALLLVSPACVQSALNPTDQVTVTGTALKEDKTPLATSELVLHRAASSTCISPPEYAKLKLDEKGAFRHSLTGADTQSNDVARCFRLEVPPAAKGMQVWADFLMQVTQVEVPTLQQWSGTVAGSSTATGAKLEFSDLSATHGLSGLKFSARLASGGGTVWTHGDVTSPVAYSAYVLEDFQAVSAQLTTSRQVKGSGTTFTLSYQSDAADLPSGQKVPASRGASCSYNKAPTVCPLTDGKLANNAFDQVGELKVTLAGPKVLKKVVLRGFAVNGLSSVVLEGSADGTNWAKLVDLTDKGYQELDIPSSAGAAKEVRLRGTRQDSGTFGVLGLDELSLFE